MRLVWIRCLDSRSITAGFYLIQFEQIDICDIRQTFSIFGKNYAETALQAFWRGGEIRLRQDNHCFQHVTWWLILL